VSLFRHPHLVRGIVHTAEGAFMIHRGVVELPEDVGDSLGWLRVDDDRQSPIAGRLSWPHHAPTVDELTNLS
jgi:hypothetical protein